MECTSLEPRTRVALKHVKDLYTHSPPLALEGYMLHVCLLWVITSWLLRQIRVVSL